MKRTDENILRNNCRYQRTRLCCLFVNTISPAEKITITILRRQSDNNACDPIVRECSQRRRRRFFENIFCLHMPSLDGPKSSYRVSTLQADGLNGGGREVQEQWVAEQETRGDRYLSRPGYLACGNVCNHDDGRTNKSTFERHRAHVENPRYPDEGLGLWACRERVHKDIFLP